MSEKERLWLKGSAELGYLIYLIEDGPTRLYVLKKPYLHRNNYYYEVTYHVWHGNEWHATPDVREALRIWRSYE